MPLTPEIRLPTASAGKGFVAAAVLRFVEQGKLNMNASHKPLVDFDLGKMDPEVTLYERLSQTAGIPDYFDESVMEEYDELWRDFPNYKIRRSADLLPLFIHKPMMYPRGGRFQYNNSGYVMLGLILEKRAGKPFDQVLRDEVFAPCGMGDTGYFELDSLPARCANAYIPVGEGAYRTNIFSVDAKGTGAGGAFTNVRDVRLFWQGLADGRVFSNKMFQQMLAPSSPEGCYGLGIWLDQGGLVHLEGCDPGVSFLTTYAPGSGKILTLMSNLGQNVWAVNHAMAPLFFD